MAGAGLHIVNAFVKPLDHYITRIVYDIGVIANAASHGVCRPAAIEQVVPLQPGERIGPSVANDYVVEFIACAVNGCRAGER